MRKYLKLFALTAIAMILMASCYSNNPWGNLPPGIISGIIDNEPAVSQDEAAQLVAAYVDELDFENIKKVATSLGGSYLQNAVTVAGEYISSSDKIDLSEILLNPSADTITPAIMQIINDGILKQIKGITNDPALEGQQEPIDGNYSMQISDYDLPSEDNIKEIVEELLNKTPDDNNNPFSYPISITVAVDAAESNSEIFHTGSTYSYKGTIYLTINGQIINSEDYGDFYIYIDNIVAYTAGNSPLVASTTADGETHRIGFNGIKAEIDLEIDYEGGSLVLNPATPTFTPTEEGTVTYDNTAVPFSKVLPLTNNAKE